MERLELLGTILSIIIAIGAVTGLMYKIFKMAQKPFMEIKKKLDEILELLSHLMSSNRYLLKYRIEQLCFRAFDECKRTGCKEIDKDLLTTINNMHAEYKFFGGNSTVDKLVERVNQLNIVD